VNQQLTTNTISSLRGLGRDDEFDVTQLGGDDRKVHRLGLASSHLTNAKRKRKKKFLALIPFNAQ
jgi:hypothetical protein